MKKYVLAIWMTSITASALAQNPGDLNLGFGMNGHQVYDLTNSETDLGRAIAIQDDGKILIASRQTIAGDDNILVTRINPDGSLDNSFDFDGKRVIDINTNDEPNDILQLSNGKIVIVGSTEDANNNWDGIAIMLNSDGSLDNNFGTQGIVQRDETAGEFDFWTDAHETADGHITIGGYLYAAGKFYFSIRSISQTGTDSPAFNSSVKFTEIPNASNVTTTAIDINSTGGAMVAGYAIINGEYKNVMCAYTANGQKDNNFFATSIRVFHLVSNELNAILDMKYDHNDNIVAVGVLGTQPMYDLMMMRVLANGYMDTTFASTGWVQSDLSLGGSDEMTSVHIMPDNRILCNGRVNGVEAHVMTAVFEEDGDLDATWGQNGKVINDFGYGDHMTMASALRDGKLYSISDVQGNTSDDVLVASHYAYSTVGVSELSRHQAVIYPNPASRVLNVEVDPAIETVQVLDLTGRVQIQLNADELSPVTQINVEDLPSGVYLIRAQGANELHTNRFVIQ